MKYQYSPLFEQQQNSLGKTNNNQKNYKADKTGA